LFNHCTIWLHACTANKLGVTPSSSVPPGPPILDVTILSQHKNQS
jgi:hypothetical protein